jgi:hypothetical protein
MDLNYKNINDKKSFRNIMKHIDPFGKHEARVEKISEFFYSSDFLRVANVKVNKKQDMEEIGNDYAEHSNDSHTSSEEELGESKLYDMPDDVLF